MKASSCGAVSSRAALRQENFTVYVGDGFLGSGKPPKSTKTKKDFFPPQGVGNCYGLNLVP